jgi:hypothetical protein
VGSRQQRRGLNQPSSDRKLWDSTKRNDHSRPHPVYARSHWFFTHSTKRNCPCCHIYIFGVAQKHIRFGRQRIAAFRRNRWRNDYADRSAADILAWGAQLLTAADEAATGGAYQRIAAATDYDVSNPVWRPYLAFDGVDDSFGTSSIDFSATDEMTVFAGVTKLSDAAQAVVVGFGNITQAARLNCLRQRAPQATISTLQPMAARRLCRRRQGQDRHRLLSLRLG